MSQGPFRGVPPTSTNFPPPGRGGALRWILIGVGGCLTLVVLCSILFVGCLAVIGTGGGGQAGQGGSGVDISYNQAKSQAVPVGEVAQAGDVSWNVLSVQEATELKSFGQRKQGNFVIVDLTFTNNGNEAVTLDSNSLAILDNQGRTFETDPDASLYVPMNKDLFLNQVNPGVTESGRAIFEIASDAEGLILRAGDTDPFTDENVYINLGV